MLFEKGKPSRAFRRALHRGEILASLSTLEELNEVLGRKKFDRYLTPEERHEFLRAFVAKAVLVEPADVVGESRDPKDDRFLAVAVGGHARYLVTGDDDLLVLNPFRDVAIVTPKQFLDLTGEGPRD